MLQVVYSGYNNDQTVDRIYVNDIVLVEGGVLNGKYAKGKVKFIGNIKQEIYYGIDVSKGLRKKEINSSAGSYDDIPYFKTKDNQLTAKFVTIKDIKQHKTSKTSLKYTIGDMIEYKNTIGKIRFIGTPSKSLLYGIELNSANGKHDGTHKTTKNKYFECKDNYGIYVNAKKKNIIKDPNPYYKQLNITQHTQWIEKQKHLTDILIYGYIRIDNNISNILNISTDDIILLIIKYFNELSLLLTKFFSKKKDILKRCHLGKLYKFSNSHEMRKKYGVEFDYVKNISQCFMCNNSDLNQFKDMGRYQQNNYLGRGRCFKLFGALYHCFKCKYYMTEMFKSVDFAVGDSQCLIGPSMRSGHAYYSQGTQQRLGRQCTQCNRQMMITFSHSWMGSAKHDGGYTMVQKCDYCNLYETWTAGD